MVSGVRATALMVKRKAEEAAFAAVIRHILREQHWQTRRAGPCIGIGNPISLKAPSPSLLRRIREGNPEVRSVADATCTDHDVLLIAGVRWISNRAVEVSAGDLFVGTSGRPAYLLRRGLLGKWRVKAVYPAE